MPKVSFPSCVAKPFLLAAAFCMALTPGLQAADGTWVVNTGGTWSTTTNWTGGIVADGAGSIALFARDLTVANQTITLDSSRILGSIRLGDTSTTDRRSYIIAPAAAETLTLDNGTANALISQSTTSNGDTISVPVLLNSSLDLLNMASDRTLTLSGTISSNTAGLKTITLTGFSPVNTATSPNSSNLTTGAVTLSGVISNGTAGQVGVLVDSPSGSTLTLGGTNTFTGGVTLTSGTLVIANTTALGASSGKFTINGGYLSVSGTQDMPNTNAMEWNGNFTSIGGSQLTMRGAITMTRDIGVSVLASQMNLQGAINDGGGAHTLTKSGAGTLYLTGINTYTGGTIVEGGTLVANKLTSFAGTGPNILVKTGATIAMNIALTQAFLDRVDPDSVGTVALWTAATSAALDFSALPGMRLGAASSGTYSGTLTPHGATYRLGGAGATLTVTSVLGGARSLEFGVRGTSVGSVILSGANTYTGSTTLLGNGLLQLNGNSGRIADTSDLIIAGNGTFRYDNTAAAGALAETMGALILQAGDGTVLSQRTAAQNTTLTFASVTRSAGATGNFTVGGTGAAFDLNAVVFGTAPAAGFLNQGLFAGGNNYAAYDSAGYVRPLAYGTDADTASGVTGNLTTGSGKHVDQTGAITGQGTESIKTLRVGGSFDTTLSTGATLTLSSGGILKVGNNTATISGGTGITTGGNVELVIRTELASDTLNINTSILATSTGGLTKSGLGTVVLGAANSHSGTTTLNAGTLRALGTDTLGSGDVVMNGGTLDLRANGSSPGSNNGSPETLVFGNNVTVAGDSTIAVNNVAATTLFLNKTIQLGSLTFGGNTLTVTNSNGYGLEFTGTTTLSPGATGNSILNLGTGRTSNLTQALTLSGKVTGTSQITVRGSGTVHLTNATNDFVGDLRVTAGVLAASSDGALGNAANNVQLIDSSSGSTFRATGTFATSRGFTLGNGSAVTNVIQVVNGSTFTLNSAFLGNNGFTKSDNGTFEINANNAGWDGDVLIQDGVLRISNSGALGTTVGTTQVSNLESALHLNGGAGGITIADDLLLYATGVNSTGALLGLAGAGTNTASGAIRLNGPASIGVETGGTLNLTSATAITGNTDVIPNGQLASNFALTLTGGGSGLVSSAISTGSSTLTKLGTGTWTLTAASTFTGAAIVNQGTLTLSGGGQLAAGAAIQLSPGATLVLDNTSGHLDNRLGTRGVHFAGNLTVIGDASAPTVETITGSNLASGNTAAILTLDAHASQSLTFQTTTGSFTRGGQGTVLYRGDNLGNTPGAGVATMLAATAPAFVGQVGAAGTINRGILPWAIVDQSTTGLGTAFATYSSTNGIMALNAVAGEQAGYLQATANVALATAKGALASLSVNSLNLGNGGGVTTQPLAILTIESGGVLAFTGNTGVQGGLLQTTSNRELIVHGLGDINIGAVIANSSGGITKTGAGTLTLSASNLYTGATTVNQGTLKLSGGDNTLVPNQILNVNHGGTLDLNGNVQATGSLRSLGSSGNEAPQYGGIVTSTGGAATLAVNQSASSTFAGQVTGDVSLAVSNGSTSALTLTLVGDNTHTGATLIAGGIVNVRNDGRLSGTSSIDIQYGSLRLDNSVLSDNGDRVADSADITLRGGTLSLYGRPGAMSSETVGDVVAAQGLNIITSAVSTNTSNLMPQAATLTLGSFTRNAAAGTTVNFGQSYTGSSAERLGLLASSSGSSENILVTGGLATTNNIIGAWAVVTNYFNNNSLEFAGYDAVGGVGALNAAGFAGYDGTVLPATSQPTHNIRINADGAVASGGLNINTLNIIGNTTDLDRVITFADDTDVLNLTAGGLAFSIESNVETMTGAMGATPNNGRITAGGLNPTGPADLFIYHQNKLATNTFILNSAIIDNPNNGGQPVRLIVSGTVFGPASVVLASTLNSYTGGTVVNAQILQIGTATAAGNLVGGGLTLNGGTVTQVNGTIAAQDVTLNGPSILNLIGTNTLNAITFDNNGGGTVTPAINIAAGGTLNLAGNVTATSSNLANTAVIAGGTLSLNGSSRTFNVSPITFNGESISPDQASLSITSVISGAGVGIVKTGAGLLQLSGASTFTGGVDLQQGGLVISAASTPTSGTVTSGPLGTGTLTIGNNTTITADATARTVANAVTVGGDFTMGVRGVAAPGALTLSGTVAWGSTSHKVTVNSNPSIVQTISGQISGTGGITKDGIGTLALTANNSTTLNWTDAGDITVNNGTLRINADAALGAAPTAATAGNIVLNGGALSSSAALTLNANRGIALGDATGSGTGVVEVVTSTLTYNGVITDNNTGSDHLLKSGAGTLSLGGASTHTGHTTVGAGTLTLTASGSINNSDRITVNTGATFTVTAVTGGYSVKSGQTLEGAGTVTGNVTALSGATIAPGTMENRTADKLTFTAAVNLNAGSTLKLDISAPTFTSTDNFGGNAPGSSGYNTYVITNGAGQTNHDLLSAATLTQNTGAQILVLASAVVPVEGQIYNLIDWTTAFNASSNLGDSYRTGANDSSFDLDLPDISGSGLMWDITNFASAGVLVVVVPEPGRCMLLLIALAGLIARRRRM